ncbi:MAG: ATP-binding protein [Natronomonas sp.]
MNTGIDGELRIVLIEDNPGDARLFEYHLETGMSETFPPTSVTTVDTLDSGIQELIDDEYDLTLLDLGLPNSSGLETVNRYFDAFDGSDDPVPVVVLTGLNDEETAVSAIESGAQDYLVKDNVNRHSLTRTLRYALERHRQQTELRRQNDRLVRFASVVSHDLRSPLNVAKMRLEMLDDEEDLSDSASAYLESIDSNIDRMAGIIDDMLTLARGGNTVEETEAIDLSSFVRRCWNPFDSPESNVTVETPLTIEADRSKLRQIFENLFRNSVEHGPERVTVRVGRIPDGFYVEDDGPGIPLDDRDSVFEAGFTTDPDGIGYGLKIVEEITKAHGWAVDVVEGSDGGARFEFTGVTVTE